MFKQKEQKWSEEWENSDTRNTKWMKSFIVKRKHFSIIHNLLRNNFKIWLSLIVRFPRESKKWASSFKTNKKQSPPSFKCNSKWLNKWIKYKERLTKDLIWLLGEGQAAHTTEQALNSAKKEQETNQFILLMITIMIKWVQSLTWERTRKYHRDQRWRWSAK